MIKLPSDVVADNDGGLCCPWCRSDVGLVRVPLEALAGAYIVQALARPYRSEVGEPDPVGLVADCDACARPFLVALQDAPWRATSSRTRVMRLLAVRTAADLQLLHGPAP
jgi:hypothetical protein